MNILVCIKRVPDVGSKFRLTDDGQTIDTTSLGFTISPHEECAVEEAISIIEKTGGNATVLTLVRQKQRNNSRTAWHGE